MLQLLILSPVTEFHEYWDQTNIKVWVGEQSVQCKLKINHRDISVSGATNRAYTGIFFGYSALFIVLNRGNLRFVNKKCNCILDWGLCITKSDLIRNGISIPDSNYHEPCMNAFEAIFNFHCPCNSIWVEFLDCQNLRSRFPRLFLTCCRVVKFSESWECCAMSQPAGLTNIAS